MAQTYAPPYITEDEKEYMLFIKNEKLNFEITTSITHVKDYENNYHNPLPNGFESDSTVNEFYYGINGELLSNIQLDYLLGSLVLYTGFSYQYDSKGRRVSCYKKNGKHYDTTYFEYKDSTFIYNVKFNEKNIGFVELENNMKWHIIFNDDGQLIKTIHCAYKDEFKILHKSDSVAYFYNNKGVLIGEERYNYNTEYIDLSKNEKSTNLIYPSPKQCKNIYDKAGKLISSECYTAYDNNGNYIYMNSKKANLNLYSSFTKSFYYFYYYK